MKLSWYSAKTSGGEKQRLAIARAFADDPDRRVLKALFRHEPMPKAPKWHFWVKNRRS